MSGPPRADGAEPGALAPALLVGLLMAAALAPLGSSMIAVALPAMGESLGSDGPTLTQLLVASYLIVSMACQGPAGKLGDLIGHQRNLRIGLAVYGLGSLLGFALPHLGALTVCRVLMAAGASIVVPSAVAELRNRTAPERRARAFAAFGVVMGVAAAVGPLLGGELTEVFGWRSIFAAPLVQVVAAVLLVEVASRRAEAPPARARQAFDLIGALLLLLSAGALVAGLRPEGSRLLAVAGAVAFAGFVLWERRVEAPAVDLSILRRPVYRAAALITCLFNLAMYPILFQLPIYFAEVSGAAELGRALVWMMAGMVVCAPIGARLSERIGVRLVVSVACVVAAGGVWLLSRLEGIHVPADAIPALALIGCGLGLGNPCVQTAAMGAVDASEAGMAAGLVSTMRYLGGVLGIAVMGALVSAREGLPPAQQHAAPVAVYGLGLVGALVLAQGLPRGPVTPERSGAR